MLYCTKETWASHRGRVILCVVENFAKLAYCYVKGLAIGC